MFEIVPNRIWSCENKKKGEAEIATKKMLNSAFSSAEKDSILSEVRSLAEKPSAQEFLFLWHKALRLGV